ncbi:hypothetical protein IQ26_02857 [Mesorhizobium tianshanense]|uniref:Uncharacterized protein n=1 Tax=Mesorhizobium tianshanense TaxID=39844 RepID=A0A562NVV0_9HYPH|nr:hypothetical protein IQ26_02857 [Mesorhizobium tianshanense]
MDRARVKTVQYFSFSVAVPCCLFTEADLRGTYYNCPDRVTTAGSGQCRFSRKEFRSGRSRLGHDRWFRPMSVFKKRIPLRKVAFGSHRDHPLSAAYVRFPISTAENCQSAAVKSFGRRQAYESPRGRNPRAPGDGYGDFGFRQMSAIARPPSGSSGVNADRPLRCASARCCRDGGQLGAALSAPMITMDARGFAAGG